MDTIRRTFDILAYSESHFNHNVALAVKRGGKWEEVSTESYRATVDAFGKGLISMGYGKGDKIATVLNNGPEWNFIDFGMSQIGAVHVSIYPTISDVEYRHILSHSDARILIISSKELYEKIAPLAESIGNIEKIYTIEPIEGVSNYLEIISLGQKSDDLSDQLIAMRDAVEPEDLLTIIYTSGTTGLSKGVMLTHNNVVSNIKIAQTLVPYLKPGDRALSFLPLCHILERVGNYLWQFQGLIIYYPESMETLGEDMKEIKVNTFITVPRVFEKVYDKIINKGRTLKGIKKILFFWAVRLGDKFDPDPDNRSKWYDFKLRIANKIIFSKWREALGGELKGVISGGAALQARLARVFWAAGIIVQEGYGLTETSPLISGNNYKFPGVKFGSVGFIPEGIEVKIADDGEIFARGENIMLGYYKDEAQTNEVIDAEGWFHTGDVGHVDDQGLLHITDRKKEMFKLSGGKYVAPQHVENKMKESQFIDQIIVLGDNRKFTSAIIVPDFHFLHNWCYLHDVFFHDNKDLIAKPKIIGRIQKEVDRLNSELGQVEKIKVFKLSKDEWNVDNGLLSPTQKIRRKKITGMYQDLIDEIYAEN
jgi:long-chain acyl-CoA synthetase